MRCDAKTEIVRLKRLLADAQPSELYVGGIAAIA